MLMILLTGRRKGAESGRCGETSHVKSVCLLTYRFTIRRKSVIVDSVGVGVALNEGWEKEAS
jgi:hypothetical protein